MIPRLPALLFILLFSAAAYAEEPLKADEEPASDQDDPYYAAMLKSINLDRNRWRSFSKSLAGGPWFYDTGSIKKKSGRVSVTVTVYPNPHNTKIYRAVHGDHSKIRRIVMATEIDCGRKAHRQTGIRSFGYDEQVLSEFTYKNSELKFVPIKASTTTDTLREIVCSNGKKGRK